MDTDEEVVQHLPVQNNGACSETNISFDHWDGFLPELQGKPVAVTGQPVTSCRLNLSGLIKPSMSGLTLAF